MPSLQLCGLRKSNPWRLRLYQSFPPVPQGFPAKWSPTFKTVVGLSSSGREVRWPNQQVSLWQFELLFEVLRDQTQNQIPYGPLLGFTDYMKLCQHWLMMYGRFNLFFFDAPWDNSRANQLIGVGDGTTHGFVAYRSYGFGATEITEFVGQLNAVSAVYLDGISQSPSSYIVEGNAIVFSTPPAVGVHIAADFSFYYLCHFLDEKQDFEEFFKNYWQVTSLKFRSVNLGGTGFVSNAGTNGDVPLPVAAGVLVAGCVDVICLTTNGLTWTSVPYPDGGGGVFSIPAYGNGRFVLIDGTDGEAYYSTDSGVTWNDSFLPNLNFDEFYVGIAFGAGLFVVVSSDEFHNAGRIVTSPDGITWTTQNMNGPAVPLQAVGFYNGLFVAISDDSPNQVSLTSPDGINWTYHTPITALPNPSGESIDQLMGVGLSGGNPLYFTLYTAQSGQFVLPSFTSPDGINWTVRNTQAVVAYDWSRPAFDPIRNLWVIVAQGGALFPTDSDTITFAGAMTSSDGIVWTQQQIPIGQWLDVIWFAGAGVFVAVAQTRGMTTAMRVATSPDGVVWTIVHPGVGNGVTNNILGVS